MKLLQKNKNLENIELDEIKVLQIKQALSEYKKLKEIEQKNKEEQRMIKEYQMTRKQPKTNQNLRQQKSSSRSPKKNDLNN